MTEWGIKHKAECRMMSDRTEYKVAEYCSATLHVHCGSSATEGNPKVYTTVLTLYYMQWFLLSDVYRYQLISHSYVVVLTAMYGSYVMCDLIVWENTNNVHFSGDMGKYNTRPINKLFAKWLTPCSLAECCSVQYRTQMNSIHFNWKGAL